MASFARAVRGSITSRPSRLLASPRILRVKPLVPLSSQSRRNFTSSVPVSTRAPSSIAQRLPDPEKDHGRFREFDLEGKVFVVTGGGRGLGLTLAEVLVEAGGKGMSPYITALVSFH